MIRLLRNVAVSFLLAVTASACVGDETTGDEQNVTASSGRFELFVGNDGQHYFQLIAKNGEQLLASEGYTSLSGAKKGVTSVKSNGVNEKSFKVLEADNGEFYFNLVATNGQVIGTSELYTTKSGAEGGVAAVIRALKTTTSADAASGNAAFETFKGQDGKTYFHLRAGNGEIVLQSQGYTSKSSANGGIDSVKNNAVDASRFQVFEGANGQHTFRLVAGNGQVIGRGEMYASKSNALRGADGVRDIVRDLVGKDEPSDAEIKAEIERAADGLLFMSESDFPFSYVSADIEPSAEIDEALVREAFASLVDGDEAADKPMAELFAMSETWQEWKDSETMCADTSDEFGLELCTKMRGLEQVIEANLSDIQVYYFGGHGEPGHVDGIGVSVFIVGRSPSGALVGVRTIAIWT
jgi:hypothetical protein